MKGLLMALGGAAIGLGIAGMFYRQRRGTLNQMPRTASRTKRCGSSQQLQSMASSPGGSAGGTPAGTTVETYPTNLVEQQVDNNISPVQEYSPSPTLAFPPNLTISIAGAASLDNMNGSGAQNVW